MARHRPQREEHVPLRSASFTRRENAADGDWLVRTVSATAAVKDYRCPGCDQVIRAGLPHVVTWPDDDHGSVTDRRHWHTPCWAARDRRRPGRR